MINFRQNLNFKLYYKEYLYVNYTFLKGYEQRQSQSACYIDFNRYLFLKKTEPITICTLNKLKYIGTVQEIRTRLSNFYKGNLKINDLDDRLDAIEKQNIINIYIIIIFKRSI